MSRHRRCTDPAALGAAQAEFQERTGGGVGGMPVGGAVADPGFDPATDLRWPECATTARGEE